MTVDFLDIVYFENKAYVVKTKIFNLQFFHKLKTGVYFCFCVLHCSDFHAEILLRRSYAEHIYTRCSRLCHHAITKSKCLY